MMLFLLRKICAMGLNLYIYRNQIGKPKSWLPLRLRFTHLFNRLFDIDIGFIGLKKYFRNRFISLAYECEANPVVRQCSIRTF